MASFQHIQMALQVLRKAAVKGKTKKSVLENIDNVSSSAVLLNSTSPSILTFDKLVIVFRVPLVSLYSSYTEPALNVTSAILKLVLNNGILPDTQEGEKRDVERQSGWERVVHSLLSGVIDFLENNNDDKTKTSIAKALYAPICNLFLKDRTSMTDIGVSLRCTAYMLLSDTATLHHDNQSRLRDQKFLGAHALGLIISRTRDFAVLEALLNLFAILLPSSSAPQKRSSYIRDVFSDCGKQVVELLDGMPARQWDETAAKVIDILAASDISFPQPFDVYEVVVCGNKYPQPEVSDRFYVDRNCFFVNVQQEDGLYEDLQIRYTNIEGIWMASAGEKTTPVSLTLKATPKLGDQDILSQNGPLMLHVDILNRDVPRFKEALHHRKLEGMIAVTKRSRISVSATLDLDEHGMQWQTTTPIPSQKVKEVESFYESDPPQAPSDGKQTPRTNPVSDPKTIAAAANPGDPDHLPKLNPAIFGGTDEDLSEMDNADQVPIEAEKTKFRARDTAELPTSKPANVIVLSDDEAVEIKPTPANRKDTKKRPQRRVDSDEEGTLEEPKLGPAQRSTKGISSNAVAQDKTEDEFAQSGGKSIAGKRSKKSEASGRLVVPSGRPRRMAAATASAKLAKTLTGSDDHKAVTALHENDAPAAAHLNAEDLDTDSSEPSVASPTKKAPFLGIGSQKPKQTNLARSSKRAPRPFETTGLRSSSPTSKISRMKAKNLPVETKVLTGRGRKRATEKALSDYEVAPSRKRSRVDFETANEGEGDGAIPKEEQAHTNIVQPPQKYGHRGRKAKTLALQKGIDWDKVPTESTIQTKQQEAPSPDKPAKVTTPAKGASKENVTNSKDIPNVATPAVGKSKVKPQPRSRAPLQAIPQTQNETTVEQETVPCSDDILPLKASVGKKVKNNQPTNPKPTDEKIKGSVLPSLEDILLKGATVGKTEVSHKAEPTKPPGDNDNAEPNLEVEGIEGAFDTTMDSGEGLNTHQVFQEDQDHEREFDHNEGPRTPLLKKFTESTPVPRVSTEKSNKPFGLDAEMIDLTDEDIKEVLQSLRARRSKKEGELGNTSHLKGSVKRKPLETEERESSQDENEAPILQGMPLRPKVTFDEKPRYKSISLESLPFSELAEPRKSGTTTKYRLSDNQPGPRRLIEPSHCKRQENQTKKDPGMEDIINVLDAIQNVVVSNISNKSRAVRSDIRAARDRLIHEAVTDLHEMGEESIGHYNNMLLLENEYANVNRKLNTGFENVVNVNTDICKFVRQTINTHDRGSLSKKMPQSLFVSALPVSFQKFA